MNFKNERLMMSKEEARNRAKELLNENQVDLITKYMFLEQQCKKQKEVINKAVEYIKNKGGYCEEYKMTSRPFNTIELDNLLQILEDKEVSE